MMRAENFFSGLYTAEQMAERVRIDAVRLRELADAGFMPHHRIDNGEPLFKASEVKRWVAENLAVSNPGRGLPALPVVVLAAENAEYRKLPVALRTVSGVLDVTAQCSRASGIYFLCDKGEVAYIGQSVNIFSRVPSHSNKQFDSVFFLPWPADDLNRAETALILALQPALNGRNRRGSMVVSSAAKDTSVLSQILIEEGNDHGRESQLDA